MTKESRACPVVEVYTAMREPLLDDEEITVCSNASRDEDDDPEQNRIGVQWKKRRRAVASAGSTSSRENRSSQEWWHTICLLLVIPTHVILSLMATTKSQYYENHDNNYEPGDPSSDSPYQRRRFYTIVKITLCEIGAAVPILAVASYLLMHYNGQRREEREQQLKTHAPIGAPSSARLNNNNNNNNKYLVLRSALLLVWMELTVNLVVVYWTHTWSAASLLVSATLGGLAWTMKAIGPAPSDCACGGCGGCFASTEPLCNHAKQRRASKLSDGFLNVDGHDDDDDDDD